MLKMNKIRFIIGLYIILCTVSGAYAETKYMQLISDADKAIGKGEYAKAIGLLGEALQTEPDNSGNVMLMSNIGMLHYYTNNDSMAIAFLSMAHDMAPESITILSNRAKVYSDAGYLGSALDDWNAVAALDSTLYRPYLSKGVIYMQLGDTLNARQELDRMCQLTETAKSTECTAALAWLAAMTRDNAEGVKQYSILIADEPTADLYAARAMCYVELEEYTSASEDIAEGLKLNADCPDLYLARALLNKRTYRNDDALNDAQRAIELGADKQRVRKIVTEL